jgi:predicted nucleic acid-binding protein
LKIVLDTSVLVDHLRRVAPAVACLGFLDEQPSCSEITRLELIVGLRSRERRAAEALLALIDWVPVDEAIARRAGEVGRRFRASHTGIDAADLAIAATAGHVHATVVTANVRHFPMFPDPRPPY